MNVRRNSHLILVSAASPSLPPSPHSLALSLTHIPITSTPKDTLSASVSLTPDLFLLHPLQPFQLHPLPPPFLPGRRCSSDRLPFYFQPETFLWMLSSSVPPCSATLLLPVEAPRFSGSSSASRRTGCSRQREASCWEWTCVSSGVRCWSCCG